MKKLLFLLLLGATVQAQITTKCKVCPPSLTGVTNGAVLRDSSGRAVWQVLSGLDTNAVDVNTLNYWSRSGNAGTNPATDFIGTTDGANLRLFSGGTISLSAADRVRIKDNLDNTFMEFDNSGGNLKSYYPNVEFNASYAAGDTMGLWITNNFRGYGLNAIAATHRTLDGFNGFLAYDGSGIGQTRNESLFGYLNFAGKNAQVSASYDSLTDDATVSIVARNGSAYNRVDLHTDTGLVIRSQMYFIDGTQGAGKVLTSDANGLASWQTLALTDTATLNFGSISPNGHETLTITVTGAALSDVVSLGIPNASMNDHASFVAWVSSANTVSVKCFNFDGSSFNPAAGLFTVKVFK